MEVDKQMVGFEREERYHKASLIFREQCPNISDKEFLPKLLDIIDPKIQEGLAERRICKRKLQYIGELDNFFEKGKIYNSIDFNGGTYTIEGYDRLIGSTYFKVLEDVR